MGLLNLRYVRGTQHSQRIEGLSDGVFAIVMTILVLELGIEGLAPLAEELSEMGWEIFQYFMTFIVVGSFWLVQFYQFHFIERVDSVLLWLNILFLATVALIPFSYSLLVTQELAAMRFYTFNVLGATVLIYVHWWYATRSHRLVDRNTPREKVNLMKKLLALNLSLIVFAILFSFVDYQLSLNIWGTVALFYLALLVLLGGTFGETSAEETSPE
jgi:uncharacterized membrane protein